MPDHEVRSWTTPVPGVEAPVDTPLGTLAQQDASAVAVTGGAVSGTTVAVFPVATGLVGAGTVQGDATVIAAGVSVFGTVAAGTGAKLPAGAGLPAYVFNRGAQALLLYPGTGGQINALGANTALSIASGGAAMLIPVSATQWHALLSA